MEALLTLAPQQTDLGDLHARLLSAIVEALFDGGYAAGSDLGFHADVAPFDFGEVTGDPLSHLAVGLIFPRVDYDALRSRRGTYASHAIPSLLRVTYRLDPLDQVGAYQQALRLVSTIPAALARAVEQQGGRVTLSMPGLSTSIAPAPGRSPFLYLTTSFTLRTPLEV